jgi:DNA-binding PadR family transcriptional regulator
MDGSRERGRTGWSPTGDERGWGLGAVVDQVWRSFEQRVPPRERERERDIRAAVLLLLADGPRRAPQLLDEIGERSDGTWRPTPGMLYPTLQLLADEGLVTATEVDGRRTWALTDTGRAAAEAARAHPAPWSVEEDGALGAPRSLGRAAAALAGATAEVARGGSPAQAREAAAVLDEARRRLYAILARS